MAQKSNQALPEAWVAYVTPFAEVIGKTVEEVSELLKSVVGEPSEQAISILQDVNLSPDADIKTALSGTPSGVANQAIAKLRTAATAPAAEDSTSFFTSTDVLPSVPDDGSWLQALKVGGVLKFNRETVIGAVSAALAGQVGLYDLPKRISQAMEAHAEGLDEPVPAEFYELQRSLTERSYSEIFAAIPGATGRYASQARKDELLSKLNSILWPSLIGFQDVLSQWLDSWQKGMANPAAMMGMMVASRGGASVPPGMMDPPPTDQLRDSAESVITSINKIFAGTGIPVAMAMAYDAQQIRKVLENDVLPNHIGASNREQMLRMLDVAVSSDYPRLEVNLKRYTLGVIELPNVASGQTELSYITALYQLGATIPWSKLEGGKVHQLKGRTQHPDERMTG